MDSVHFSAWLLLLKGRGPKTVYLIISYQFPFTLPVRPRLLGVPGSGLAPFLFIVWSGLL